jgi:hypothetical protein
MFELLLQADKSLSEGLLDQAERTYWQLIELDPTNAIAMAGLAMISLERLDKRLARTFAERALGIDPDSIVARRVLQALNAGSALAPEPSTPDAAMRGAEKLEALSRRHTGQVERDEGDATESTGREKGYTGRKPAVSAEASAAGEKATRGGPRLNEFESPTSEPLRERRKAGRLAAAAAAAAAAAHEPAHTRHEPHHAMPAGRRAFEPTKVRTEQDPFAAAEMAAAVAAVDAMDETFETESWPEPAAEPPAEPAAELAAEPAAGVAQAEVAQAEAASEPAAAEMTPEATAQVSWAQDAATAETTVAGKRSAIEWPANDRLASARAPKAGGTGPDDLEALRRALLAVTEPEDPALTEPATQEEPSSEWDATVGAAAEIADQAEAQAADQAEAQAADQAEAQAADQAEAQAADQAEAQAAVVAPPEVAAPKAAQPEGDDWDLSEANAEREALREAVAIVMDEDGDAGVETATRQAVAEGANAPDESAASAPPPARSDTTDSITTEPQTPSAEAVPDATAPVDASAVQDPAPRKKGLFRRIRGN